MREINKVSPFFVVTESRTMLHFPMIESFDHKGLKKLFENGDRKLVQADLVERIRPC